MNLEQLKLSFFNYLQKTGKDDDYNLETSDDVDISLFVNNGEFKSYLNNTANSDVAELLKEYDDVDFGNIAQEIADDVAKAELQYDEDECLDVEIVHEKDDDEEVSAEETDDEAEIDDKSLDETSAPVESDEVPADVPMDVEGDAAVIEPSVGFETIPVETEIAPVKTQTTETQTAETQTSKTKDKEHTSYIKNTLETMYQDEDVIKALDLDGDGVLNDEEKAQFEAYAQGYDDSADRLTKRALDKVLKDIKNGDFSYDNDPTQRAKAIDKAEKQEEQDKLKAKEEEKEAKKAQEDSKTSAAQSAGSSGGVGGSYGGGGVSSGASGISSSTTPVEQTVSLEELESQKAAKETELKTTQDEIKDIYSGDNPAVKAAEDECDKTEQDYKKAVEEDKNISQELKEQMEENLDNITAQEQHIDGIKIQITEKDAQISTQNSVVSADESNLNALKQSLQTLEGKSSDDAQKQAEIEQMKATINAEITKADAQLKKDKETLQTYEKEKADLEKTLSDEEDNLKTLNEQKDQIDKQIFENCSEETKQALEAFNQAKENVEKIKAQELQTAQEKLTTIQSDINELDKQINEKKAQETQKEYSVGGEFADLFNDSNFKGSVLDGKGEVIEELCEKYNVDPYLAASIIANETGWGTSKAITNSNNPGGFMDPATNWQSVKKFGSLDEGLEAVIKNLGKNYLDEGRVTIQTIGDKYCPVGASNDPTGLNSNWIPGVTKIYNMLSGQNINKDTKLR